MPRRDTIRECFGITVAQVIAALVITVAFIAPDAIVSLLWGL